MKKVFLTVFVVFLSLTTFAQKEYRQWAIGAEFGAHSVSDESAISTDPYNHFGLDVRYNVNEIVGVGLDFGKDNLALESVTGEMSNMNFTRLHAKATISVFELLRLPHRNFNMLFSGGPGVSRMGDENVDYTQNMFSVSGGVTAMARLNDLFAAKLSYTSTAQIAQDRTLDNIYDLTTSGISSVVDNVSAGIVFHPRSKKNKGKVHADWYSPAPVVPVVNNITQVTEVREITKEVAVPVPADCKCKIREFVFFDHDKHFVKEEALNAITKVYTYLAENEDAVVKIYGFASPTQSSAEYNRELSAKRGDEIARRLEKMGISPKRIEIYPEGKDYDLNEEYIHDIARRVEMIVE